MPCYRVKGMAASVRTEDFDSVQRLWEGLLPSCVVDTVFFTHWWQCTWWRYFCGGSELRILSVHENDMSIGIAPLRLKGGVLSFIGDTDLFDYHDFLVVRGREAAFYQAIWAHIESMDWHTLDLKSLQEDSPTLHYLPEIAGRNGCLGRVQEEDRAPVAPLPHSWDEYLSRLSRKARHELRRKLRRLEQVNERRQYVVTDPQELPGGMPDFFRLLRASSPDKREFLTPKREEFFVDVARELAKRDQLRLAFLEVSGVRVAACMACSYGESYLLYNSGYDPQYSHLSVGLLNKAFSISAAIEENKRTYNFLRGTERYKYDLGGQDHAIYRLTMQR